MYNNPRIGIYICLILTLHVCMQSCSREPSKLDMALNQAGDNRKSLDSVLAHYKGDTLKLKCAEFLISNSAFHSTCESSAIDSIEAILALFASPSNGSDVPKARIDRWKTFPYGSAAYTVDAAALTPEILIKNVDSAVEAYTACGWNKDLPFEDFCQYILPYRLGNERLCDWRKSYADRYGISPDSLRYIDDSMEACRRVLGNVYKDKWTFNELFGCPRHSALWLLEHRAGYCRDGCDYLAYALRACGIPAAIDNILGSPENGSEHQWMVVRDSRTGLFRPFWQGRFPHRDTSVPYDSARLMGKVYREVFGFDLPESKVTAKFSHPGYIDVTAEYFGNNEARVPLQGEAPEILLGVFCNGRWTAIGKGESRGDTAVFSDLEPGIFYCALAPASGGGLTEQSHPFTILTDGTTHVYAPDNGAMHPAAVSRKKVLTQRMLQEWMDAPMRGSMIKLYGTSKSGKPIFTHKISDRLTTNRLMIKPGITTTSRYLRYEPAGAHLSLGELEIYSGGEKIDYKPISPENIDISAIKDGKAATYADAGNVPYIDLDLGKHVVVDSILVVPRNDDNFVWPGDEYELFAHQGAEGWKSLGVKTATDTVLSWNVPANSLLWLHNRTKGREEQPFVIRDGRQWFTFKHLIKPES